MGDINWEGHFGDIGRRNNSLEKSWGSDLSPSRENILNKARAGTYENNAANRKKGIAGMKYGGMKVKEEGGGEKEKLLKQVKTLTDLKKKLYSNMDIESPKSNKEKELDKKISTIYSKINQMVREKQKAAKE